MEPSRKLSSSAVVLLFLLLVATEMGTIMVVKARLCEQPSNEFKGVCLRSQNCANKCKLEGYIDGKCKHLARRCYCSIECGSGQHGGLTPAAGARSDEHME